jgi:hypothetical protein
MAWQLIGLFSLAVKLSNWQCQLGSNGLEFESSELYIEKFSSGLKVEVISSPAGMTFFPYSNIVYDIIYDVVYDIVYDISYAIV